MNKLMKKTGLSATAALIALAGWAQSSSTVPEGWHLKDLKTDGYYGISLDKAYDFLKSKKQEKHTGYGRYCRLGDRYHP